MTSMKFTRKHQAIASGVALALGGIAAQASVVATTPIYFASETAQSTTVWTIPAQTDFYTVKAPIGTTTWYLKVMLPTGAVFTTTPTLTLFAANGTDQTVTSLSAAGTNTALFIVSQGYNYTGTGTETFDLGSFKATWSSAGSADLTVQTSAALDANFTSTIDAPTYPSSGTSASVAKYVEGLTITTANDTDYVDLNPASASNAQKVFAKPDAAGAPTIISGITGSNPVETSSMITYPVSIAATTKNASGSSITVYNPDGATTFKSSVVAGGSPTDTLTAGLTSSGDFSSVASVCFDGDQGGTCGSTENLTIASASATSASATLAAGAWYTTASTTPSFILTNTAGAIFGPRTFKPTFTLNVIADTTKRPSMTAHTYSYTLKDNSWTIEYANGTLLRSAWFLADTSRRANLRIVNAGSAAASIVTMNAYLDSAPGTAVAVTGGAGTSVASKGGVNFNLNSTTVAGLGTGSASRGYLEVIMAGSPIDIDAVLLNWSENAVNADTTRNTQPLRNVTFDSGIKSGAAF